MLCPLFGFLRVIISPIENRLVNKITGIYSSVAAIAHDIGVINNDIHSASIQNWPALSNQHQQPSIHPPGVSHINLEKPTLTSAVTHGGVGAKNSNQASGVYKQRPQHANEGIQPGQHAVLHQQIDQLNILFLA